MNLSELISEVRKAKPPRIVLHGVHGIGKSTFGAQAPAPVFIPTEDGLTTIKVNAFPLCGKIEEVFSYMDLIITGDHQFETLVIDTLDSLERLIYSDICEESKIPSIENLGYGKGYVLALGYWDKFLRGLDKVRERGMAIILIAHNEIKTFTPPDNQNYDRWQVKLHKLASARIEEWADCVLFANYKAYVKKENAKDKKGKAVGGERVIYTSPNPAYKAKNRYNLPEEIPMDFNVLLSHIKGGV